MSEATATPPPNQTHPAESSLRETLESIIIAFVLAFVFRAFVVEAFVIPTGSMAPTLLGQHMRIQCPDCGYRYVVGPRHYADPPVRRLPVQDQRNLALICPMCQYPIEHASLRLRSGDRILVLKYVYAFREPKRWEVVVFKNPERPQENYIKRLVGLPNEQLWILQGDLFTRPLLPSGRYGEWGVERKPDRVQRAVWQPVYHSDYRPLEEAAPGESVRLRPWKMPWTGVGPSAEAWTTDPLGPDIRFQDGGGRPGILRFDFNNHNSLNFYFYNETERMDHRAGNNSFHDFRFGATIKPDDSGLGLWMLGGTDDQWFRGSIDAKGLVRLQMQPKQPLLFRPDDNEWLEAPAGAILGSAPLSAGRGTRVELWHVDQSLSFWADGRCLARWTYGDELDAESIEQLAKRRPTINPPTIEIGLEGSAVALRAVNLDRDLYYTQPPGYNYHPVGRPIGTKPLGTAGRPATIGSSQYFCLGDNSPASKDSRLWERVDPWANHMVKKITGADVPEGLVPRQLMLGKAFFVYFPAPYPVANKQATVGVIPNFGRMRFIR
ncbi:MAG: S26 family signal peptidase [Phycisphaerae bacterium]|nr:S26 family signal peptidase [Phycisphaerae bacterium]